MAEETHDLIKVITKDGNTYVSNAVTYNDTTLVIHSIQNDKIKPGNDEILELPIELKYEDIQSVEKVIKFTSTKYFGAVFIAVFFAMTIYILSNGFQGSFGS